MSEGLQIVLITLGVIVIIILAIAIFTIVEFNRITGIINSTFKQDERPMGCGGKAKKKTKRK